MRNKIFLSLVALVYASALIYAVVSSPQQAKANPSTVNTCTTYGGDTTTADSTYATSSLAYMTPGTATTTLSCSIDRTDEADVLIALKASSTATTLGWRVEFSRNNQDWYAADNAFDPGVASSTEATAANFTKYTWTYASSTPEENQGKTDTAFKRIHLTNLGNKYMRIKFYLPAGSQNGAVQAEMDRKYQIPYR